MEENNKLFLPISEEKLKVLNGIYVESVVAYDIENIMKLVKIIENVIRGEEFRNYCDEFLWELKTYEHKRYVYGIQYIEKRLLVKEDEDKEPLIYDFVGNDEEKKDTLLSDIKVLYKKYIDFYFTSDSTKGVVYKITKILEKIGKPDYKCINNELLEESIENVKNMCAKELSVIKTINIDNVFEHNLYLTDVVDKLSEQLESCSI